MVVIFEDDDEGYRRWLSEHRHGYVVNTHRPPSASYLMLHVAACHTIKGDPTRGSTWTAGEYSKVCSASRRELQNWAHATFGTALTRCGQRCCQ